MMKRMICALLICCTLLLPGCNWRPESTYIKPVHFYYPRVDIVMEGSNGVITYETREGNDFADAMALLDNYLKGPWSGSLYSPFPVGSSAIDCTISGSTVQLMLSNHFDQLVGIPFTLSTSCIAMTLLSYTGLNIVEIHILNENNNEVAKTVTLTRDQILLSDGYEAPPAE